VAKPKKLVFGCGYLGRRVARLWRKAGAEVWVSTRQSARATALRAEGFQVHIADVTQPESLAALPRVQTVLYAVGYDRSSGQSQREVYVDGLVEALRVLWPGVERLIFTSSTGVYGQSDGQWVDERSICEPIREGGQVCLAAEDVLRSHSLGSRAVILRLAGLYGPGRIPYLRNLVAGEPLRVVTSGFLNLIHVDDAARAVLQAERRADLPDLFVVSDGTPVTRRHYYEEIAAHLGVRPRFAPPAPRDPQTQRAASNKRVSNHRLLEDLQVVLQYPSYREGLADILKSWGEISGPLTS
jgi:nucleoside-diphosphate-sugar epimerase